jgi:hypothetical protein
MTPRLRAAIFLAALGLAGAAPAQAQVLGGLTYTWANPAGDLSKNFIGNDSWLGFSVEGRRFFNPNMTIGVSLGYTAFYESTTEPIFFPGATVSGEQYRSMNVFPLLATAHLYSKAGGRIQTYIGLGVGVYYFRQLMDVGPTTVTTNNWIIGFAPELGFIINKGASKELAIFGKYNYPANAGKFLGGESGSYQYLSVGISIMGRR